MFKVFKIGEIETFTINDILKYRNKIDFSPVYQRHSNIWDLYKKQLFIDTILNDYDIPKLYFNYFIDNDNPLNKNNKLYAVVDGKQRLETIIEFFEGKFKLSKTFSLYEDEKIDLAGLSFDEIQLRYPLIVFKLLDFKLDIIFISTDDEERLEDMFLRLNGGEALTNAEKRNAIGGAFNETAREIVNSNSFFTDKLYFSNKRFQHQDLFTRLVFLEYIGGFKSMTNKALNEFVRENKNILPGCRTAINQVIETLGEISKVFNDKSILLKSKGLIPVYYELIKYNIDNISDLHQFFFEFEELRIKNRKLPESDKNSTLINFDRHNQQAVHTETSLKGRFSILSSYYEIYKRNKTVHLQDISDDLGDDD